MTFIRIDLVDWIAVFYIVKWLSIGFVIGAVTMVIIKARKKNEES